MRKAFLLESSRFRTALTPDHVSALCSHDPGESDHRLLYQELLLWRGRMTSLAIRKIARRRIGSESQDLSGLREDRIAVRWVDEGPFW